MLSGYGCSVPSPSACNARRANGLRASELCELQWSEVEFESATLHLRRSKGGQTGTHPLLGDELRALRALKRDANSPFIFVETMLGMASVHVG